MAFWKPGTAAPGSSLDRAADRAPALVLTAAPGLKLPILAHRHALLYAIERFGFTILIGQTGSGKSTQLPQFLHEAGWTADGRQVAICEPRRIAATSLASRVATEAGYVLGGEVGYAIRFEELTSKRTRIKYLTDVVVDEAHERSCYTDLLLGVLKKIQAIRKDLRVVVCSATLDAEHLRDYFNDQSASQAGSDNATIISIEGRMYPVEIAYLEKPYGKLYNFNCSHSHGNSFDLIVATNVAEASVTSKGLSTSSILASSKLRKFDVNQGIDVLSVCPVSKASAIQRTGRAGRTSRESVSGSILKRTTTLFSTNRTEICRTELTTVILQLKALGIDNVVEGFEFLDPPSSLLVERALEFLYALGALDESGRLTNELGLKMAECLVESSWNQKNSVFTRNRDNCSNDLCQNVFVGASSEEVNQIIHHPFIATEGDHFTYLNVYNSFIKEGRSSAKWCAKHRLNFKALSRAINIRGQLVKYLKKFGVGLVSCGNDEQKVRRCLVSGYFKNVALMKDDGSYRGCRDGNVMFVHPSSVMFNRKPETGYVVYHEITETKKKLMRDLTVIDSDWLTELAGHYYQVKDKNK
ncbi:hypothetical protein PSTT_10757 [Puccinia striiformis]|uniref:Uncharacterized protein n=1 Tax=Puccinia striiformis TaxID=27350 RepID=A0A2S4V304_9BASI|nr:hypothetical protein PSTT_10757 [Puccinia striiformis]